MKKGFTLIELLIVIAIVSLFSILVFSALEKAETKRDPYSIKNLKEGAPSLANADVELLCINKCAQCFVHPLGSDNMQEISSEIKPLQAYIVDSSDTPQKVTFGRYDDKHICLRYRYYANGSSTQIILESEEKFFYFPTYFGKVSVHDSLEEATQAWIGETKPLLSQGGYYR